MAAAILSDEQACDLALNRCSDPNCPWLCQRLQSGRGVGRITINFTRPIEHHRTNFNPDARVERRLANTGINFVQLGECPMD
jgi:hypothetical protein